MEEVVAQGGMQLVVQSVVGTEAVINTTIGDVDIGKALQSKCVAQQVLGDTEGGQAGIPMLATCHVFMGVLG